MLESDFSPDELLDLRHYEQMTALNPLQRVRQTAVNLQDRSLVVNVVQPNPYVIYAISRNDGIIEELTLPQRLAQNAAIAGNRYQIGYIGQVAMGADGIMQASYYSIPGKVHQNLLGALYTCEMPHEQIMQICRGYNFPIAPITNQVAITAETEYSENGRPYTHFVTEFLGVDKAIRPKYMARIIEFIKTLHFAVYQTDPQIVHPQFRISLYEGSPLSISMQLFTLDGIIKQHSMAAL